MMESRKSEAGVSRPKEQPKKQVGMTTFVLVGVGVVAVIVLALLLFGGGGKKKPATTHRASTDSLGEAGYAQRPRRSTARHVVRPDAAKREEERAKRRAERLQRQQEARASGRTTRSSSGGYTSGGSTRATSSPNELRAILTDNTGARTALVGERRLKAGDDIEGRRIVEVTSDGVKVEYRQNTYTVRIGEKVY